MTLSAFRAEIRRMTEWFDIKLYREAVEPLFFLVGKTDRDSHSVTLQLS